MHQERIIPYGQWQSWICAFISFLCQGEACCMLEGKQCIALPTNLHNLMEGAVSMEAHSKQTCDNTWTSLYEKDFSDEDNCTLRSSPLALFLPCGQGVTLVGTSPHPGPLEQSWLQLVWMRPAVDILLPRLDTGRIYVFCQFQRLDPGLHKAAFSPRSGWIAYWIHQHLQEIPCSWHKEQKNKPYWQSLVSFKSVYGQASGILRCLQPLTFSAFAWDLFFEHRLVGFLH